MLLCDCGIEAHVVVQRQQHFSAGFFGFDSTGLLREERLSVCGVSSTSCHANARPSDFINCKPQPYFLSCNEQHRENISTRIKTEQRKAVSFCKPHCKSSTNERILPDSVKPPPVHGVDLVKTRPIYCTFETGSGHATPAAPLPPLTPPPHHLCESHRMHAHLHTSSCTKKPTFPLSAVRLLSRSGKRKTARHTGVTPTALPPSLPRSSSDSPFTCCFSLKQ
ncbi:unnamed protein product [Leuciscus chuanchicus]